MAIFLKWWVWHNSRKMVCTSQSTPYTHQALKRFNCCGNAKEHSIMIWKIKYKLKIKGLTTERSTHKSSICIHTRGQPDTGAVLPPGGRAPQSQTHSRRSCPWTPDRVTCSEALPWRPGLHHFMGHFRCLGYKQEPILIYIGAHSVTTHFHWNNYDHLLAVLPHVWDGTSCTRKFVLFYCVLCNNM